MPCVARSFNCWAARQTTFQTVSKGQNGHGGAESLSDREGEVLRFIARGFTNKEVANLLGVSIKTVETYKTRLNRKLNLHSRADVVRYALAQGWLQDEAATPVPV